MGDFYCKNCDIHREFPNLDTALAEFDHAVAIHKGRMCPNNNLEDFLWDGMVVALIKHPERYPTNPSPKLVPRQEVKVEGDSSVKLDSPTTGNDTTAQPKDAKLKAKKPKTETK